MELTFEQTQKLFHSVGIDIKRAVLSDGVGMNWNKNFSNNRTFKIKGPCGHFH